MLWSIKTSTGTPVLPSYKGKRGASAWDFSVDKKYWQAYKDEYAMELAPFFRAKAVKCAIAEGDDMIYAAVKKYSGDYDDIIVITRDSDMSQIDVKNTVSTFPINIDSSLFSKELLWINWTASIWFRRIFRLRKTDTTRIRSTRCFATREYNATPTTVNTAFRRSVRLLRSGTV